MGSNVLPTDDEVQQLVPGVGSITWRRAADIRATAGAGYALVLQVAHPTVGAGVTEHSDFKRDPWGRLWRTLDFTSALVYAEPRDAAATCRAIRALHTRIKGVRPDGTPYHALEPDAYAWVHASLWVSIVASHERFGSPLRPAERDRFWFEWRRLGRLLGVRERDLPATTAELDEYFDAIVADVLEDTQAVRDVLETLSEGSAPPLPPYARPLWWVGRIPLGRALRLATVGLLPEPLRDRLALRWSRADELELRALGAASRASRPLLPYSLRVFGPTYRRWRGEQARRLAETAPPAPVA